MLLSCTCEIAIVSKYEIVASNGKTYYHIGVVSDNGYTGDLACSPDVYPQAVPGRYHAHFNLNTAYLRKDYNCSVMIDAISPLKK